MLQTEKKKKSGKARFLSFRQQIPRLLTKRNQCILFFAYVRFGCRCYLRCCYTFLPGTNQYYAVCVCGCWVCINLQLVGKGNPIFL